VLEARRLGIRTLSPCINHSRPRHFVEREGTKPEIRPPLSIIKKLSREMIIRWWDERTCSGPFDSLAEFRHRVAPSTSDFELLLAVGALDCFGRTQPELYWDWQRMIRYGPRVPDPRQPEFFESPAVTSVMEPAPPSEPSEPLPFGAAAPTAAERAARETELLGFPVSLDPYEHFGPEVLWESYCPIEKLGEFKGRRVTVCGLLVQTRHNHTIKGEIMMFCTLADPTGFVECSMFPRTYRRYGRLLELGRGRVLSVAGEVQAFDNMRGQTLDIRRVEEPREKPEKPGKPGKPNEKPGAPTARPA